MRSRMDRYDSETITSNRSSKNDSLYEELYKEKPVLRSNVTVIDNVKEIDINKIKEMVDNRENYRNQKSYENIVNNNISKDEIINYDFDEIDDKDYDINEILERKRTDRTYDESNKLRKLKSSEYEELKQLIIKDKEIANKIDDSSLTREEKLTQIINTLVQKEEITDLFANLKEDINTNKEEKKEEKEDTFYTESNKIVQKDFGEDDNAGNGTKVFVIIVLVFLLIAAGIFIWLKYFK